MAGLRTVAFVVLPLLRACLAPCPATAQGDAQAAALSSSDGAPPDTSDSSIAPAPLAPAPRFWGAVLEVTVINAAALLSNRVSGHDFAGISPQSWAYNLKRGTTWDDNDLQVNQLGHPYHGAAYFNAARANGYGFWAATPFALGGSLMWEFFGETHQASNNDILSTTIGGIIVGEALRQLTVRMLDEEATGLSRLLRESAVTVLNPGLGLHRVSRGEAWHTRPNPSDPRPPARLRTEMGARRIVAGKGAGTTVASAQPILVMRWSAGDPFEHDRTAAFDAFEFRAALGGPGSALMSEIEVRAPLAAHAWGASNARWTRGVGTRYLYESTPGLQRSEAEISLGAGHRTHLAGGELSTIVSAGALPLVALSSRYLREGLARRSYDYGVGGAVRLLLSLQHGGRELTRIEYQAARVQVVNGAASRHTVASLAGALRVPLFGEWGVGCTARMLRQRAYYADGAAAAGRVADVSLFLALGR